MAVRRTSLRHWRWLAVRAAARALPPLKRGLAFHDTPVAAHEHGRADTLAQTRPLDFGPVEAAFAAKLRDPLPDRIERTISLIRFERATVLGNTGAVVDEEAGRLILTRTMRPYANYHNLRPAFLKRVEKTGGPYVSMVGSHRGHRHFFHFLIDRLPLLHHLLTRFPAGRGPVTILTNTGLPGFQSDAYGFLGARHLHLRFEAVPPGERWVCENLHLIEAWQNLKSTASDPGPLHFVRDLYCDGYGIAPDPAPARALYVARSDAAKRRILNEAKLRPLLDAAGVTVIAAAKLPFREQVRLFTGAKLIVGAHGAGLTNIVFAPPGAVVLEAFPAQKVKDTYFLLSRSLGHRHRGLIGSRGRGREDFTVDVGAFAAALDEALALAGLPARR